MDAGYRTGVFYQAMPAVGADGKNIMKLIPVQMVNGQFVQTLISRPATHMPAQKLNTINVTSPPVQMSKQAVVNPSVAEQITRKHFSQLNVPHSQPNLSLNKPLQQQTAQLAGKVPQIGANSAVCGNSLRLPNQLSLTVMSPNLPKGQCLQIPPTAQVCTVPAAELHPSLKKQICTSSASTSAGLDTSSVVSPVSKVSQGVTPPNDIKLLSPNPLSSTKKTSCGLPEKVTKPHLKLVPMVSQRPNSPIRWVIEEVEDSAALYLKPIDLSETFRSVQKKANTGDHCDTGRPESRLSQDNSVKGQDNALVMCNGKVFLQAKKCSLQVEPTAATQSSESNKTAVPSSSPQTNLKITDEVIDLCDDDSQDDSPQQAVPITTSATSHQDEDNVIFVSYIPPKSCSTQTLVLKPPVAAVSEADQADSSSSISMPVANGTNVCEPAVMDVTHNTSEQSTSTTQLDIMDVDEEPADPRVIDSSTHRMESSTNPAAVSSSQTPSLAQQHCQTADHMLRQIFGITSDVKICLQRIDERTAPTFPLHADSITLMEGNMEPASSSEKKDVFLQEGHSPLVPYTFSDQPLSATPLKNSHFTQNTKPSSALLQKCLLDPFNRTPYDTETEPDISYVAPIDEDFPSSDENNLSMSRDAASCPQTCAKLTTIIRRVGRMRKRTVCPCCIPATLDPALKSNTRLEEMEKCSLTLEENTKKGGRTKAARKDGRTSGRVGCAAARNKQNCKSHKAAAGDRLSSVDCG
ncbi:ligand-dependent nuclear receptor-interacting factor 1 [Parambassis ranga]|uniref:Ligand-dependent nuclear receptor-interacting factor 1 n=1 Tax=Parambassis ranga TaxID=210632 RepID=A0A6P7IMV1_9TELE|nr:ligand-dependent nuclear receptor-interacting factor 1 [Parambassis ranga]